MDAFNYLTAMVSVILGLGLTQLFAGIGNLDQIRRRVKLYWLHSAWVLLLIVLHIHMWWSFWALRGVGHWTYATFVYDLIGDRKSTRMNSSHSQISYAVFCLKKKKTRKIYT